MLLSRQTTLTRQITLTWRAWCLVAIVFNVALWVSVIGVADLASKAIFSVS